MITGRFRLPNLREQQILDRVEVRLLGPEEAVRGRHGGLMERHHYLQSDVLVGEQLRYVAVVDGRWVALLSWSAAARHLQRPRAVDRLECRAAAATPGAGGQ